MKRLVLTDFRCYEALRLEIGESPVVLAGANGAGKTNLLEALSFLVPGRGLRRARLHEASRREPGAADGPGAPWAVAASLSVGGETLEIGTGLAPGEDGAPRRRVVKIDGNEARSQTALGERISATWLTPEMDRLFSDGRSDRRRFLDRLIYGFDPAHAERLSQYERAMRERARLLRDGRFRGAPDPAWLAALEDRMARHGVAAAAARLAFIARLNAACALGAGPFPVAGLSIEGDVEEWFDGMSALDVEDSFRLRLAETRPRDSDAGRATFGVHRSDLLCRHMAKDIPAARCSSGEQKALLISIVLANARLQSLERGAAPLMLLDEVAAHLDAERREALFDEICDIGAQTWMTGTDLDVFAPLGARAQRFRVADAAVTVVE